MTETEIRETFRYHSPSPEAVAVHEEIQETMTEAVADIAAKLPMSRERSAFITLCQQAQMMANAAVAIHGLTEASKARASQDADTAQRNAAFLAERVPAGARITGVKFVELER